MDPLASDFSSWTPYHYVHNNPLRYTDPTGMSANDIIVEGVKYEVGATGEGESEFVQQTFAALNQIANGNDEQASNLVNYFADTEDYEVKIIEGPKSKAKPVTGVNPEGDKVAFYKQKIIFNPTMGLKENSTGNALSPDVALVHELGHVMNAIDSPVDFDARNRTHDSDWKNAEEKYNIQKWEIPYAKSRGMLERTSYSEGISIIETINSTTNATNSDD